MDAISIKQRFDSIESKLDLFLKEQEEFSRKTLLKLSFGSKEIFTQHEAAEFLGLSPKYLDQLTHHGKLKFLKRKGQKFKYFRKKDLEEYLVGNQKFDPEEDGENDLEKEIISNWQKK